MALLLTRFDFIFFRLSKLLLFCVFAIYPYFIVFLPSGTSPLFYYPWCYVYLCLFVCDQWDRGDNAVQVKYGLHVNLNFPCYATERTVFCFTVCHILLFVSWRKHQCEWHRCPRQISLWGNKVFFFPYPYTSTTWILNLIFNFFSETHQQPFFCALEIRSNECDA